MGGVAALAVAAFAIIVGPLAALITANRKLSGKVSSSDASNLWHAAEQMRGEYRDQIRLANDRIVALEARVATAEHHNNELAAQNLGLQRRCDLLERENKDLKLHVDVLEAELAEYKGVADA